MKKLTTIAVIIISLLMLSCGGSSSNEDKKDGDNEKATAQKESNKADLKTEEGVLKTLNKINIQIPEEFKFVEAKLEAPNYKSKFVTDTLSQV